jgi:hypothetical protein
VARRILAPAILRASCAICHPGKDLRDVFHSIIRWNAV